MDWGICTAISSIPMDKAGIRPRFFVDVSLILESLRAHFFRVLPSINVQKLRHSVFEFDRSFCEPFYGFDKIESTGRKSIC
jgi:hypothetical protein